MRLLIFLLLRRYGLACKYGIIFQIKCRIPFSDFLIPNITTVNQARLKQKFDSIYFLNKRCF